MPIVQGISKRNAREQSMHIYIYIHQCCMAQVWRRKKGPIERRTRGESGIKLRGVIEQQILHYPFTTPLCVAERQEIRSKGDIVRWIAKSQLSKMYYDRVKLLRLCIAIYQTICVRIHTIAIHTLYNLLNNDLLFKIYQY